MADTSEVLSLLQIANLSSQWPHLRAIHDRAMKQLEEIAAPHKEPEPGPSGPAPTRRPYSGGER